MNQRRRLIVNVLSNYGAYALFGVAGFVLVGYLVRKLGNDAFGIISLLVSATIVTELFGVGVSHALTKHISASVSKKEYVFANKLISTSLLWYVVCGLMGAIVCLVLSFYMDRLFDIPARLVSDARRGMRLMAMRVLVCFPFNTWLGLLWAYQRYDLTNLARSLTIVLRVACVIVYFELFSAGIAAFIIITIISLLIERVLWLVFSLRVAEDLHVKVSLLSWGSLVILMGFGGFILIIQIANIIGYEAVKWIVGLQLDVVDVGGYTLIAFLAVIASELALSVGKALVPVSSRYEVLNLPEKNIRLSLLGTKYAMIVASCLCVMPLLMLKPFLHLWVGDGYEPAYMSNLALLGMILLLGQWFISMSVCILQILIGIGRIRLPAIVTLSWALGGLFGTWIYLHRVHNTLFAVVVGITIARIIGTLLTVIYGLNVLKIPPRRIILDSILRPTGAGIAVCAVSYFLSSYFDVYKPTSFILVVIMLIIIYVLLVWTMVLSKSEQDDLTAGIRSIVQVRDNAVQSQKAQP